MDPFVVLILLAAVLAVGLFVYALLQRTARPGPPPRRSRTALERFWDTPEHSTAWEDEPAERRDEDDDRR